MNIFYYKLVLSSTNQQYCAPARQTLLIAFNPASSEFYPYNKRPSSCRAWTKL